MTQQRTGGGASGSDCQCLQAQVFVEHDQIGTAAGEPGGDLDPHHAIDRVGEAGGADHLRGLLFELDREHPQRTRSRVGGNRRAPIRRAAMVGRDTGSRARTGTRDERHPEHRPGGEQRGRSPQAHGIRLLRSSRRVTRLEPGRAGQGGATRIRWAA